MRAQVLPWGNGAQDTLGLGFGHWEWEKMFVNQKMGMGFENCEVGF